MLGNWSMTCTIVFLKVTLHPLYDIAYADVLLQAKLYIVAVYTIIYIYIYIYNKCKFVFPEYDSNIVLWVLIVWLVCSFSLE